MHQIDSGVINTFLTGQEGGHKTCSDMDQSKTNQGASSVKTKMTRSLNKEASLLFCDAIRRLVEDGDSLEDATPEDWTNPNGKSLPADSVGTMAVRSLLPLMMRGLAWGSNLIYASVPKWIF